MTSTLGSCKFMLALWIQCIYFSPTTLMNVPQINTHLICCWQGQATDVLIQADHLQKLKRQLNNLLVHHTKRPLDVIGTNPSVDTSCFQFQCKLHSDPHSYPVVMAFFVVTEQIMERDKFFTPDEAKDFGLIDEVQHSAAPQILTPPTNS